MGYDKSMGYRDIRSRYYLFAKIIILVALVGLAILVFANIDEDPSQLTFSMIAFCIGVAALLVAILQGVAISKQMQMTERAAREVRETGEQLKNLVRNNMKLEREIEEDIQLDHKIISVLKEYGLGEDDQVRHKVARHIALKLGKTSRN